MEGHGGYVQVVVVAIGVDAEVLKERKEITQWLFATIVINRAYSVQLSELGEGKDKNSIYDHSSHPSRL